MRDVVTWERTTRLRLSNTGVVVTSIKVLKKESGEMKVTMDKRVIIERVSARVTRIFWNVHVVSCMPEQIFGENPVKL